MALKDLIASRHDLNEDAIERIVADFVRYDPAKDEIVLTPRATSLPSKAKVLVYLVALEGWAYVKPELEGSAAKPALLERELGIAGGTLRPLLRDLASKRLVKSEAGAYRIIAANLSAIEAEIGLQGEGQEMPTSPRRKRAAKAAPGKAAPKSKKTEAGAASMFSKWIAEGYFDEPKTMSQMQQAFHNKGLLIRMTSLSKLPLRAVRSGALSRERGDANGKRVWLYSSKRPSK